MPLKYRLGAAGLAALLLLGAGCRPARPGPAPELSPPSDTAAITQPVPAPTPIPTAVSTPTPAPAPSPTPAPEDFVRADEYISPLYVDLKYATADNLTGQPIYAFSHPWLRYGTVVRLKQAAQLLAEEGYALLIWDAFRPTAAQFKLWEICPDPNYVADPNRGHSSHSRGNTVDVTLVTLSGDPVAMPTGFDDFSAAADRDYSDVPADAAANAALLEEVMVQCGFRPYAKEWWHYSDTTSYPVDAHFYPDH